MFSNVFGCEKNGPTALPEKPAAKADSVEEVSSFSDFIGGMRTNDDGRESGEKPTKTAVPHNEPQEPEKTPAPTIRPQRKTGSQKDRFNYASFDCGAIIRQSSPGMTSTTAILNENKDSYLLNQCDNKPNFVAVELCQEILVDTIVLANLEYFSSMFKHVRVQVSDRYPPREWTDLAVLEAQNRRDFQSFQVLNPVMWAKFIRLEFMTHFGTEFFCPITLLRVHGSTVMEDLRKEIELPAHPTRSESERSSSIWIVPTFPSYPRSPAKHPGSELTDDALVPSTTFSGFESYIGQQTPIADIPLQIPSDTARDSLFKSILKRLTRLEQNMTLSHTYMETNFVQFQKAMTTMEQDLRNRVEYYLDDLGLAVLSSVREMRLDFERNMFMMSQDAQNNLRSSLESANRYQMQVHLLIAHVFLTWCLFAILFYCIFYKRTSLSELQEDAAGWWTALRTKLFNAVFLRSPPTSPVDPPVVQSPRQTAKVFQLSRTMSDASSVQSSVLDQDIMDSPDHQPLSSYSDSLSTISGLNVPSMSLTTSPVKSKPPTLPVPTPPQPQGQPVPPKRTSDPSRGVRDLRSISPTPAPSMAELSVNTSVAGKMVAPDLVWTPVKKRRRKRMNSLPTLHP